MTSEITDKSQQGYLLSNDSIVNINGVRSRLHIDAVSGSIHVIPLEEESASIEEAVIPTNVSTAGVVSSTNTKAPTALPAETTQVKNEQVLQEIQETFCSQEEAEGFEKLQDTSRSDPKVDETEKAECYITSMPDSSADIAEGVMEPHSLMHKNSEGQIDVNLVRVEQQINREVLEQDLLEQFLSSVTQDFSFCPPSESTNVGTEQNLFPLSAKSEIHNTVAPYSLYMDSELKQIEPTIRTVSNSPLNPPTEKPQSERISSLSEWTFNTELLPRNSHIQVPSVHESRGEYGNDICIKRNKSGIMPQIVSTKRKQLKQSLSSQMLRPLRPKLDIQKIMIVNLPLFNTKQGNTNISSAPNERSLSKMSRLQKYSNESFQKPIPKRLPEENIGNLSTQSLVHQSVEVTSKNLTLNDKDKISVPPAVDLKVQEKPLISVCPACNAKVTLSEFRCHLLTHPNVCALCETFIDTEKNLFEHLSSHNIELVRDEFGGTELRCQKCSAQFLHAANAQRHMLDCCNNESMPENTFISKEGHKGHASGTKRKGNPAKVVCHKCGKLFGPKSVIVHIKSHCPADDPDRQTNPMQCRMCKNLFLNLTTFKRHLPSCQGRITHEVVRELVSCDLCMKNVSIHSLSTHKRLYCSAVKPETQSCSFCGTVLKHKHSLRNHVRWHCKKSPRAENPTRCACGKVFRNYKAFQSHFQNHCLVRGRISA